MLTSLNRIIAKNSVAGYPDLYSLKTKKVIMKKLILAILLIAGVGIFTSNAQRVSVRLDFPVGVPVVAPGPPPFAGAIWIRPEWTWRSGRYVCAPGYWAPPPRSGRSYWAPGHWKHRPGGYYWRRGHWR